MNTARTIGANKVITMQYSLTTTEGVVVREASGKPVTYLHGAGALFPRLERELESHRVGDIAGEPHLVRCEHHRHAFVL